MAQKQVSSEHPFGGGKCCHWNRTLLLSFIHGSTNMSTLMLYGTHLLAYRLGSQVVVM